MSETLKAALVIIGDEILSGRTQDTNIKFIADRLGGKGIALAEIRVVPDNEARIVATVNELRAQVEYLFTTGGIGPTHDDITAAAIAKAFGVKLEKNKQAVEALLKHYGAEFELTPSRLKMAEMPEGAKLIHNPVSGAPGFIIGNVYVMAGVPRIMQGMMEGLLQGLKEGAHVYSNAVNCAIAESVIAPGLGAIQAKYGNVSIGSYPHFRPNAPTALSLVLRSTDEEALKKCTREVIALVATLDENEPILSLQVMID